MKMESCLYRGTVAHERKKPGHRFEYATAWAYLDLDEIDDLIDHRWMLSRRRFAPASFNRNDHLGESSVGLKQAVRELVLSKTGIDATGPVRLLTQLRHFGVYFSPINLYFCFDLAGTVVAIVAEVSNTPWNQRYHYVLWSGNQLDGKPGQYLHAKEFHVSPFMDMNANYRWLINQPSDELNLSLCSEKEGERVFQADLFLTRRPLSDWQLVRSIARRPIAGMNILAAIYFQALRLWIKRCPFFPHPDQVPMPAKVNDGHRSI